MMAVLGVYLGPIFCLLMTDKEFLPAELTRQQRYKLMVGLIVPRPIAWVSSLSPTGASNLAPYSFYNGVSSNPMTLMFCPANKRDGTEKDSMKNALLPSEGGLGEFVVNVVTEELGQAMAKTAQEVPYGESEFDLASLAAKDSRLVRPPRVADSVAAFECKTTQVVRLNPGAPAGGNLVLGEVVAIHIREDLIGEEGRINGEQLHAIGRLGGPKFCRLSDQFEIDF